MKNSVDFSIKIEIKHIHYKKVVILYLVDNSKNIEVYLYMEK